VCNVSLLAPSLLSIPMIIVASDKGVLLAFKAGLRNSSALGCWNGNTGFYSWEGVTCSRMRPTHVVGLSLPFLGIAGTIPPAIGNLTFLENLNMSSNDLYGEYHQALVASDDYIPSTWEATSSQVCFLPILASAPT
jgi:hypothetical protein